MAPPRSPHGTLPLAGQRFSESEATHARHLRRLNLERLLAVAMRRTGPFSRAELERETSLSAPTVGSLSSELLREGLLKDLGPGPSQGGRRPSLMEFNAEHGFVVGLILGATQTLVAVADLRGETRARRAWDTPARLGPRPLLGRLARSVKEMLREAEVAESKVVTVVAGAPGAVDSQRGTVVALAPNLKDWDDVPMASILSRELHAPVSIENDVNLAILGEHWRGAAQGHNTCAFIYLGVGIGAGILIDGELHRGRHFTAGEIGLMCMGPQFIRKNFGSRGCFETLAGLRGLVKGWRGTLGPRPEREIGALLSAARKGEARARRLVGEASTLIGIAATNLSLSIDPSILVLGGPLVQDDLVVKAVRSIVGRIIPTPPEIAPSRLGDEASLSGSLLVARTEAREVLRRRLVKSREAAAPGRGRNAPTQAL